ncbi:MAG: TMEM175 family protein [Candidatus Binatia bacterium]
MECSQSSSLCWCSTCTATEPGRLRAALTAQWPTYIAYVTSYLYVGVVWLNHKAAFKRIRAADQWVHWANFGVLFSTALLPFSTAVIASAVQVGDPRDVQTAVVLYAVIGAVLCASWYAFFHYLSRHPELVKEDVHERFFAGERTRALIGVGLYAAAGVLAFIASPPVALFIFFALGVFYGITSEGLEKLPVRRRRS